MTLLGEILNKLQIRIVMNLKDLELSEFVTRPITVSPNTSLLKTREILLQKKVKRVIVTEKNHPTGVITEKDIVKKIYELGTKPIKSVKAKDFKLKKLYALNKENSVKECAKLMKKHRISLVIILNKDETLAGIITKTSLTTVFLTKGSDSIKVSKIMKTNVITAAPCDPILFVETLLLKYGISRIVIKRNQKPVGIITFRDFVPAKIPQWIAESADPKEVQEYKFKKGLTETHANQMNYLFPFHATDIMSAKPITVNKDNEVKVAITKMIKYNISGLPVLNNSRLVGIITKSDIVSALAS